MTRDSVLVGKRTDRYEMAVAGIDELPPLHPIVVRPAVRPDPNRSGSSLWSVPLLMLGVVRNIDRIMGGEEAGPTAAGWIIIGAFVSVALFYVVQFFWDACGKVCG